MRQEDSASTSLDRPDGKSGLERLWLLVALSVSYVSSMVVIVTLARPYTHDLWTPVGSVLLVATLVTIAVLSWRDIITFGGLMPWRRLPVPFRLLVAAGLVAAAAFLWVPIVIIAPVIQIVRGFIDLPKARRARGRIQANGRDATSNPDIANALTAELAAVRNRLPSAVWPKVEAIRQTILELLPRAQDLGPQELFVVRRTAVDYLPVALHTYLKLPQTYASQHPIRSGETAYQVLNDDLDLLQQKLEDISEAMHRNDSDALLVHSRFLEEKFGRSELTLPNG